MYLGQNMFLVVVLLLLHCCCLMLVLLLCAVGGDIAVVLMLVLQLLCCCVVVLLMVVFGYKQTIAFAQFNKDKFKGHGASSKSIKNGIRFIIVILHHQHSEFVFHPTIPFEAKEDGIRDLV